MLATNATANARPPEWADRDPPPSGFRAVAARHDYASAALAALRLLGESDDLHPRLARRGEASATVDEVESLEKLSGRPAPQAGAPKEASRGALENQPQRPGVWVLLGFASGENPEKRHANAVEIGGGCRPFEGIDVTGMPDPPRRVGVDLILQNQSIPRPEEPNTEISEHPAPSPPLALDKDVLGCRFAVRIAVAVEAL